jgi:uncharacterized membrane protein YdcZ (DUF606 family)
MAIAKSIERQLDRLRIWNIAVGLVLAVQAILMAVLTNNFSLPVTATFMSFTTCLISPPVGVFSLSWQSRRLLC